MKHFGFCEIGISQLCWGKENVQAEQEKKVNEDCSFPIKL